jgi:hypothetical protein
LLFEFNLDEVKRIHVSSHEEDFIESDKFNRFAFSRKNIDYLNDRLNCDIISLIESEICYEFLFTIRPGCLHRSLKDITSNYDGDNHLFYPANVNGVKLAKYITLYMLFFKGYIKVPGYAKSLSEYFDIYTYFGNKRSDFDCYVLSCSYDTRVVYRIDKTISSLTNTLVKDDIEIVEPAFKEERPELNLLTHRDINLYASIHSYSDQLMPLSPQEDDYIIKPGNPYVEKKDIPNIQKRIDKIELSLTENYILENKLYDYDDNKYKDLYPVNGKDILKVFCDTFKYSKSYFNNIIPKEGFKFISLPNRDDELQVIKTHTVSYLEACDFGDNIVYPTSKNTVKLIKFLLIHHIYKSIKMYTNAPYILDQKFHDLFNDFEKSGKTYAEDYFRIFYMKTINKYCFESENTSLIFEVPEGKSIFEIDYFDCEEKSDNTKSIKKERKNMFKNKFGKINDTKLALSYDGKIAVANNKGDYVRYNMDTATVENIKNLVIDDNRFFFMVPISEVDIGDIIKYNDGYHQVTKINENNLAAINLSNNTIVNIVKETIFGMSFYSKVISLIDKDTFSDNNSLIMFMMMEDDDNMDMKELMMMQMFTNKDGKQNINSMMLALMMDDDDDDDMLSNMMMFQMMTGGNAQFDMSNMMQNPMILMMLMKNKSYDSSRNNKFFKMMMLMNFMNQNKKNEE